MEGREKMSKFTVEERDGCVLISGDVSLNAMPHIMRIAHEDSIIATRLARMAGVNFAFGLQADVDALMAALKPQADDASIIKNGAVLSAGHAGCD